jgi:hypothetical protein
MGRRRARDRDAGAHTPNLRPQVPQIAQALPQPVTDAAVLSVELGDAESVARIRYSGGMGDVTILSRWQDEDGRPVIVRAEPTD